MRHTSRLNWRTEKSPTLRKTLNYSLNTPASSPCHSSKIHFIQYFLFQSVRRPSYFSIICTHRKNKYIRYRKTTVFYFWYKLLNMYFCHIIVSFLYFHFIICRFPPTGNTDKVLTAIFLRINITCPFCRSYRNIMMSGKTKYINNRFWPLITRSNTIPVTTEMHLTEIHLHLCLHYRFLCLMVCRTSGKKQND